MSKLIIDRLNLRSAPGLPDGLDEFQFKSGLNILFGPNASGKTTTARAMKSLIWLGGYSRGPELVLDGRYRVNDDEYSVIWERGYMEIQKNRQKADVLDLPIPDKVSLYDLSVTDLLSSSDEDFASIIWQGIMGGLDLQKAAENMKATYDLPSKRIAQFKEFDQAQSDVRKIRQEQQSLFAQQNDLQQKRQELDQAKTALSKAEVLKALRKIRQLEMERDRLATEKNSMPQVLDRLTGEEADQLRKQEDALQSKRQEEKEFKKKIGGYSEELRKLGLPEDGVPEVKIGHWNEQLNELERRQSEGKELQKQLREAKAGLESIKGEYKWDINPEQLRFTSDHIEDLADWTRRWYTEEQELSKFTYSIEQLEQTTPPEFSSAELNQGITELTRWLKESKPEQVVHFPRKFAWGVLAALVLSGIATPFSMTATWIGLAVAAAILLIGIFQKGKQNTDRADIYRQEYERTGLPEPDRWDIDEVAQLMDVLMKRRAEAEKQESKLQELENLKAQRSRISNELNNLDKEREKLLEATGLAPKQRSEITLLIMVEALRRIKEYSERIEQLKSKLYEINQEFLILQSYLKEEFATYMIADFSEKELKHVFEDIKNRNQRYDALRKDIDQAEGRLAELHEEQSDIEAEIQELCHKTGCENSEQVELLLQNFERNRHLRDKINELNAQIEAAWKEVQHKPVYEVSWADQDENQLTALQEEFEMQGVQADRLQEEIHRIETLIRKEQQEHRLEEAHAAVDQAADKLRGIRRDYLSRHIKQLVMDHILSQHRQESYPEVFEAAAAYFRRFTGGDFSLDIAQEGQGFRAVETTRNHGLNLEQLSSGTRVQLLLAVRMAFIQHQEYGVALPLFADELLAVSDKNRAEAIVSSISEMVREGRQVFYFTAQEEEVGRWKDVADPEVHILSEHSPEVGVGWQREMPELSFDRDIPEPQTADYEAYLLQLDLPKFDPLVQSPGEIPVWMLLDDPQLLYRCLKYGLDRWGKLKTWLQSNTPLPELTESKRGTLLKLGKLISQVVHLYRKGRPYPITFSDLKEANLVSANQAEGVYKLIEEVNGHPEELVRNVSGVNGVGKKRKEEIEEFMINEGYLPSEEVLSKEELELEISRLAAQAGLEHNRRLETIIERILGNSGY